MKKDWIISMADLPNEKIRIFRFFGSEDELCKKLIETTQNVARKIHCTDNEILDIPDSLQYNEDDCSWNICAYAEREANIVYFSAKENKLITETI